MSDGFIDEIHEDIVSFAERHFEDDDERSGFVDDFMERHGYTRLSTWGPPAGEQPKPGPKRYSKPAPGKKQQSPYFRGSRS